MNLSIRTRLTVGFALVFSALLIVFTGVVYILLSHAVDRKLREDSLHDMSVIVRNLSGEHWMAEVKEMPDESDEFRLLIKVLDPSGKTMIMGGRVDEAKWPTDAQLLLKEKFPLWENYEIDGIPYLVLTQSFTPPGKPPHFVQIANSEVDKQWILKKFVYYVNVGTLIVLTLAILAGYFLSKKSLAPVELIRLRAETIKSDNLHERLIYDGPPDELHRLTTTLNDLLSRLQKSINQMKAFVADASHELRIPLTGIRGTVEVAMRQKRTVEEHEHILETVYRESERLSELVWDLLALARADAGELRIEKSEVDLSTFIRNVFEEAESLNAEKKVAIKLGSVPDGTAIFDEAKIHQLLINLIENAIRYNKPGGDVLISAGRQNSSVTISVKDSGIGLLPEDQEKIFNRFYRVDKARSREGGGTGLGLSIARSIAEAHNGTLSVQSVFSHGSEFILTLPIS